MKITIIGHSTCIPDVGQEMACFLINAKHLVDSGWCGALKMREYGFDPLAIESVIFTHLHQDHYIGLPQLLFFSGLRKQQKTSAPPLRIVGPAPYLERLVKAAFEFLQVYRFPELEVNHELLPLSPGQSFELGDLRFETFAARHVSGHDRPEPALVYKVTEKPSGACFAFTGDTHYHPPIADFVKGVSLLIHDAAHTSAKDSATIAKTAGVGRLLLIHYSQPRANQLLAEARAVFPNTDLARQGETLEIPSPGSGA
jgi:ribonuclease BN (tRNA processing enzyme)